MCGEKLLALIAAQAGKGSPPRVRGKAAAVVLTGDKAGITPACAGKRIQTIDKLIISKDHPRVCGEKRHDDRVEHHAGGSPPRVRGKASALTRRRAAPRITPACAGKRQCQYEGGTVVWDHPRVCGEKAQFFSPLAARKGSPPRVRGKDFCFVVPGVLVGITPACAGKSLRCPRSSPA